MITKKSLMGFLILFFIFFQSCATMEVKEAPKEDQIETEEVEAEKIEAAEAAEEAEVAEEEAQPEKEDFGTKGNQFIEWCRNEIDKIEELSQKLKVPDVERSALDTLALFNKLEIKQYDVMCSAGINQYNHPDEGMREGARKCSRELNAQSTKLSLDSDLYNVFAEISPEDETLKEEDVYYLNDVLADFRRNGVDKDEETRERLKKLSSRLTELYQKFHANIASDTKEIVVTDPEQLRGLPEDFISQRKPDEEGRIILTTDWPDYLPVIEFAEYSGLRERMYRKRRAIAIPANTEIFSEILKARQEWAQILGYENWAAYSQEKLMAENPENAHDFITKILELSSPHVERELEVFMKYIRKDDPEAEGLEQWDRMFYQNMIKKDKYDFDSQEVRKYFEISKVMEGVFKIVSKIFGVDIEKVERDDVWHPSVESYDVIENGEVIGHFELDMYPRPDKYKHFAMFSNRLGVKDKRLPRGAIVGNFPEPDPVDGKAYLSHHDVETIFHEFGHLLHMIFGSQKYLRFSGTRCQRDFVEVPSTMLEEWAWDISVLQMFATDDDGNPIPEDLVERMKKASEFGKSVHVARQMYLAMLSLGLYTQDAKDFDFQDYERKIERKYSPTIAHDDIRMTESFGHLIGYSSNYYTYMWSTVIAMDMFAKVEEHGLLDPEIMNKFREKVLSVGGSKDGTQIIFDFLGRDLSFEAFENWLAN